MTEPSKERIAAALALAEASLEAELRPTSASYRARADALSSYRATAPRLRTRAEVDRDIALRCRSRAAGSEGMFHVIQGSACSRDIDALIREPLPPDPTDSGSGRDDDAGPPLVPPSPAGADFHKLVAEALGLMDGDNGSYIYADEDRCLAEIAKNAREGELWREHVQRADECGGSDPFAEPCDCASRHLKVIGGFEAEARELRQRIERTLELLSGHNRPPVSVVIQYLEGKP